jgi:hypothetical protein
VRFPLALLADGALARRLPLRFSMAPRLRSAVVRIHGLPELVLHVIMLALPVDARARAACVCRSWRALLADPSLWQVLVRSYSCWGRGSAPLDGKPCTRRRGARRRPAARSRLAR